MAALFKQKIALFHQPKIWAFSFHISAKLKLVSIQMGKIAKFYE